MDQSNFHLIAQSAALADFHSPHLNIEAAVRLPCAHSTNPDDDHSASHTSRAGLISHDRPPRYTGVDLHELSRPDYASPDPPAPPASTKTKKGSARPTHSTAPSRPRHLAMALESTGL